MSEYRYPDNSDLRKLLRFSAEDGLIWLDESRMMLWHAGSVSELRKEVIQSVGVDQARRIITRAGFTSGLRDAELARKIRGTSNLGDAFSVGPQLHMLEGVGRVEPLRLDMNFDTGRFYGEFLWENSIEAEIHLKEFGTVDHPVCWMQLGYASGFTSAFMGRFVLYREVECMACGGTHCRVIGKPVEEWLDADRDTPYFQADSMVDRMLELHDQIDSMREAMRQGAIRTPLSSSLIGTSDAFREAFELLQRAASTNVTVLLLGETGVGKERFARELHSMSQRHDQPFVAVNCAALPGELIESELFGVERGAFTGAHASRAGKFERANGGTLFLDEIGELPVAAQAKLLRVLQEGEIERLGDERTRKVNVRLVAATNVDLQNAVEAGRFRRDLFYRLNVYAVTIPPLRERASDIPLLAKDMLKRFTAIHGKRIEGISDRAIAALKHHAWRGNVRELENVIERGIILAPTNGWIETEHLFVGQPQTDKARISVNANGALEHLAAPRASETVTGPSDKHSKELAILLLESGVPLEDFEQVVLECAVDQAKGNLAAAARQLGITRPKLEYRLKKQGGVSPQPRPSAVEPPKTSSR